jgi:hypothetical protein
MPDQTLHQGPEIALRRSTIGQVWMGYMAADFRRHDATAKSLSAPDRQTYALEKAKLVKDHVSQAEADEVLNAFFWRCFEDDDEDEGDVTGEQ